MTTTLVLIAIAAIVFMLLAYLKANQKSTQGKWPYKARPVLTEPEKVLFYRLREALPECEVLAQVALSRIVAGPKGKDSIQWFRKISQKSVDFVVCLKDFSTVAVIELDDSTHNNGARRKADGDKDKALIDAGLTIIRWNVKNIPNIEEIRKAIAGTHATPSIEK